MSVRHATQRQSCKPMFILLFLSETVCQQKILCSYIVSSAHAAYSNGEGSVRIISLSYLENSHDSLYPESGVAFKLHMTTWLRVTLYYSCTSSSAKMSRDTLGQNFRFKLSLTGAAHSSGSIHVGTTPRTLSFPGYLVCLTFPS